jgi:phytoene dehydrogenase-like protein
LLHAVAQASYYEGGGYFIKGGSQKLSDYLAKVITDNGGKILTRAEVIRCSQNSVTYIHKKQPHTLSCDIVISNLSPSDTYGLYGMKESTGKPYGISLYTVYLGFSRSLKSVYGKKAYSNFMFDDLDSIESYNAMIKQEVSKRGFVFVDYSQIDSGLVGNDKSFGAICGIDYIQEWEDLDKEVYRRKKSELIEATLQRLEKEYPGIGDIIEYAEVGTAKTVKRYIKTPQGTPYGYKPTPKNFFKIPKSKSRKIDNLYFVGQWVIAGGFSPAILSGALCYKEITKTRN